MLSFQDQYTQCQKMSQDDSAAALVFFKANLNLGTHQVEEKLESYLTEEPWTDLTEANVYSYPTLDQFVKLKEAHITIGTKQYPPLTIVEDENEWQTLRSNFESGVSDITTHIFVRGDTFELYPTPATAGNTITLLAEMGGKDLQFDDYTDGNIVTLAHDGTTVTGSSTTWTNAMIGRYFKINAFPVWYKITGVGSTTGLTLAKQYQGLAIAAGSSSYTIGEMPRIPHNTHQIPVWYALMNYYLGYKQNTEKFTLYKGLYESDLKTVKPLKQKRSVSNYIPGNRAKLIGRINPNNYPTGMTYN